MESLSTKDRAKPPCPSKASVDRLCTPPQRCVFPPTVAPFSPTRSAIFALLERQEVQTARASLATFAKRLCRDDAAPFAVLQQPWRNGPPQSKGTPNG